MITTSVDTRAVSEVIPIEVMRVNPPASPILAVSDAVNVSQSIDGVDVSPIEEATVEGSMSAERTQALVVEEAQREQSKYPHSARANTKLGMALLNAGRWDEATQALDSALSIDEGDIAALSALARVRFRQNKIDEAAKLYERIAEIDTQNIAAQITLASIALRNKDYLKSIYWMERVIESDPSQGSAHYLLAMIYLHLGKTRQAISTLRRAVREDARSAELRQGLAVSFLVIGDQRRAEEQFRTALSLQPDHQEAVQGLANLLIGQGRTEEAIEILANYATAFPGDTAVRERLAHAYVLCKQYGRARSQLFAIVDHESAKLRLTPVQLSRIRNNIGFCYVRENRYADAELQFIKAIELEGKSTPEIYENLARVYLLTSRATRALRVLGEAVANGAESTNIILLRSASLIALHEFTAAIAELESLVRSGTAPAVAYADLGWLLGDWEGDYPAAISVLNEGLDRFGTSTEIINNLAYSHLEMGHIAAARALVELLPPDDEKLPHMLATKGLLLLWEGNVEEGDQFYKLAADRAGQISNRPLMIAIRQKRSLEMARALIRIGQTEHALNIIREGLELPSHGLPFRFDQDLSDLMQSHKELPDETNEGKLEAS